MGCVKDNSLRPSRPMRATEWARELHAGGKHSEAATALLRGVCSRASECQRVCPRFVKALGKADVWCVDPVTLKKTLLYPALEKPEFRCPLGHF